MKAFKYRLYPNKAQIEKLHWTLDRCREVYNAALQERRDRYTLAVKHHPNYYDPQWRKEATKAHAVSLYDQQNQLAPMKEDRPEYRDLSAAHLLNDVCKRVDLAMKGFFKRVKAGRTPGFPRFLGKTRYDSFCYPDTSGWKLEATKQGNKLKGVLHLTRIGTLKVKIHRPVEGTMKTCTVKREGEHWYVVIVCEGETANQSAYTDEVIGIDLGVTHFAALSSGDTIENPRYYHRTEKKLEKAQQALARKKKPHSKPKGKNKTRRHKGVQRVAKLHRKVRRQRQDFLHKQSRQLVDTYETLVFENIKPANLSRKPKPKQDENGAYVPNGASAKAGLNKSILDAGWATFVQYCTYKAEWAGRDVLRVDPRYTSQICSGCGTIVKKDLSERWHSCSCGCELDRDVNAAVNIRTLGMKIIEGRRCDTPEHSPSQPTNEAGSASAFGASVSPGGKRRRRAADTILSASPSQDGLWAGEIT